MKIFKLPAEVDSGEKIIGFVASQLGVSQKIARSSIAKASDLEVHNFSDTGIVIARNQEGKLQTYYDTGAFGIAEYSLMGGECLGIACC